MAGSPIRLRKAASDFNVGTATIIEFLNKKGHALEDNPNTKIPEDLYVLLINEFSKDRATKMDADKISIGNKKETISLDDKPKKQNEEPAWDQDVNINIKSHLINDYKKSETPEKPEVVEKKEVKSTAKSDTVADKPKKSTKKVKETETPLQDQLVESPAESTNSQQGSESIIETPAPLPKEMPQDSPMEKEAKCVEHVVEETVVKKPKVSDTTTSETTQSIEEKAAVEAIADNKENDTKTEAPLISTPTIGVKVVGSIDLDALNMRKESTTLEDEKRKEKNALKKAKKKAKKAAEKLLQAEATQQAPIEEPSVPELKTEEPQEIEAESPAKKDDNMIPTQYVKLEGTTVVGKIDLSQFQKKPKKPVASSSNDQNKQNKKKRKRIKEGATTATTEGANKPSNPAQKNQAGGFKKDASSVNKDNRPNKPDFNRDHNAKNKKPKKKEIIKVELTEEEIQRQVRETLSKLTSSSKSKGSKYRREKRDLAHKHLAEQQRQAEAEEKILKVTEFLTANELATMMNVPVNKIIAMCMSLGLFVSINQRLGAETISIVADELGYQVEFIDQTQHEEPEEIHNENEVLIPRQPVVTVMGHVDHGKTKLLDYIRRSNVVAGEAGGITQHIGAYSVQLDDGRKITFLDTPGHEAFTAMRARGAKLTDIVIIVIAADDSVMPQTKEAINHAQAAGVPIVFAINKIDKQGADPDRVRTELSQMNILVEEWGGKYQCQEISAKQGINVDKLLEKVLLEAELLDLKANPDRLAKGTVIESKLEHGRGYVSSVLVENGTLRKGDIVLCGQHYGRVKAMFNEREQLLEEAGPATPVLLVGLNGAPQAGDTFAVYEDESEAKKLAVKRQQLQREMGIRTQ
ncbi:MAG: translation initiation factor IF-2, partial [Bacteroidales bacterium]|nr:translation initiation factor IF-2 [Bacteroidales bacterium]